MHEVEGRYENTKIRRNGSSLIGGIVCVCTSSAVRIGGWRVEGAWRLVRIEERAALYLRHGV